MNINNKGKNKIWIYIIIGISVIVIGGLSWGFATNWKFIGENTDNSKSSGGSPTPTPTPTPESQCDPTKCKKCSPDKKKCIVCYEGYTLNDGICVCQDENKKLNKCCPKGSTRDNAGTCCSNSFFKNPGAALDIII